MTNVHSRAGGARARRLQTGLALAALLVLGACSDMHAVRDRANPGPYGSSRAHPGAESPHGGLGTVQAIEVVRIPHSGRAVVASGGGMQTSDAYRITVRMRDGSYQALTQSHDANLRVGDRVQVANGVAQPYR